MNETAVVSIYVVLMLELSLQPLLVATEGLHSARVFELKVLSDYFEFSLAQSSFLVTLLLQVSASLNAKLLISHKPLVGLLRL